MTITDKCLTKQSQQSSISLLTERDFSNFKIQIESDKNTLPETVDKTTSHDVTQSKTSNLNANEVQKAGSCEKVEGRVDSFDHVTFWVGNAKQSAVFYMTQFGFQPFAFCGLETGSRDVACHVVKLNDTIIQFVSAVKPNNEKINNFLLSHGDAVKDVAFRVENIEDLLKHALEQGAELINPLEILQFNCEPAKNLDPGLKKCLLKKATIKTFGDITHTFIERNYEYERAKFLPGYKKPSLEVSSLIQYLHIQSINKTN